MRVRDTFIEVLGRTSATEEACAELEKFLERADDKAAAGTAVEEAEISSDPAAASHPESPEVSKDMGHAAAGNMGNTPTMQTVVMQGHRSDRVENRCPSCGCGRFCGSCGAQIWQSNTFPVNMASMTSMASMTPMATMTPMQGYVGYASGYTPAVPKDSPTQTPDPADTVDCSQTVMFPMFQMGQTPYMLMPADSGQEKDSEKIPVQKKSLEAIAFPLQICFTPSTSMFPYISPVLFWPGQMQGQWYQFTGPF